MAIRAKQSVWPVLVLVALAILVKVLEWRGGIDPGGRYERIAGCRLAEHRWNDGDSFQVALPDGRREQVRLYFVDAPESAFKTYRNGENNHRRIAEQARDLGVSPERAVELGKQAKARVAEWLGEGTFELATEWDDPFGDRRYHAFVALPGGGWLHERLVREGLVRIHTKGAALPDGTSEGAQQRHLRELESEARRAGRGAWAPRSGDLQSPNGG